MSLIPSKEVKRILAISQGQLNWLVTSQQLPVASRTERGRGGRLFDEDAVLRLRDQEINRLKAEIERMEAAQERPFWSTAELADAVGVTSVHISRLCRKGEIEAQKIGNSFMIVSKAASNFIVQQVKEREKRISLMIG